MLGVIVLLAGAMRFYKLGEWSFWIDEIKTVNAAREVAGFDYATQPINLALINLALSSLAIDEWSARLVPALVGVLTILVLYFPVKNIFGPGVALLSCLLLAVSPWHLFLSQSARFYTLLLLLYGLSMVTFYFGIERDRPSFLIVSLMLLGLAARERLTAGFYLPVVFTYLLLVRVMPTKKPLGLRRRNVLLLLIPALGFALFDATSPLLGRRSLMVSVYDLFVGNPNIHPFRLLASFVYRVGLPVFFLGLGGGVYLLIDQSRAGLFLLIGALIPLMLLLVLSLFTFSVDRYVFITLPNWIILSAVVVKELFSQVKKHGWVLAASVIILILMDPVSQDMLYFNFQNGNRPDWKGAFTYISRNELESESVFTTRPELGSYYLNREVVSINQIKPEEILNTRKGIWFVIGEPGVHDPILEQWILENCDLSNVWDVYLPGKTMMTRVYHYSPPE